MISEEPAYSRLAARLLAGYIDKEVRGQGIASFSQSVALGHAEGLIGDEAASFVKDNAHKLDFALDTEADGRFEYFGLRTVYDRYLLRHPTTRLVLETSADLARTARRAHPAFGETRAAGGQLQPDLWDVTPTQSSRWTALRDRVALSGPRNSLLVAIAPTATIASIAGCYECIEPQVSNLFKRETLSGEFLQVNAALVAELKAYGLWTPETRDALKPAEGSVQELTALPAESRELFRTAWELPQKTLIDLVAARAPYIDHSQSLNLFMAEPSIGKLSSMYLYAWKSRLKTTYYLRSRPATRISQATVTASRSVPLAETVATGTMACSVDSPESCEGCQ
ncbi:MAG: hypothetical protein KY451_02810 [Actinobacteria bacterium]|nr:hypothetical protein [Actinomycetota bacterium]MBW3646859.1 hypothetical protein [Actinomycetota bacterium]